MPNIRKNSFYRMDLISGAVALNARLKDMPLAEGDETYELKGGFNTQVFVMTGNVAKTPSFGAGELNAGYLRTYVNDLSISGASELPKLSVYNFQDGIYVTEPNTTTGWTFPPTIEQNIAVYSSQFDSGEVWLGEYFDGADKSVGVTSSSENSNLSLKDAYLTPEEAAEVIFIGGDAFIGGGETDIVKNNLRDKFSARAGTDAARVYLRPLKKNRMKGLWTATADHRDDREKWAIYTPFWKWDKIQPILKYGKNTPQTAVLEDKDATTNNTIFNHISTSGDYGDITSMTSDSPLLESKVEISTTKSKTGGTSLRMYHLWQTSESASKHIEKSLGANYINPQVAKAAIYDIPIPVPLDLGAFDYPVSSSTGPAVELSGTASWGSGSSTLIGADVFAWSGSTNVGSATVTEKTGGWGADDPEVGQGVEGADIPSGAIIEAVTGTPVTSFLMNVDASDGDGSDIAITGSDTRWKAGLQDTTIEGVVSGTMIRAGYQNFMVRTIENHYTMTVDRPLTAIATGNLIGAAGAQAISGPLGAESGKTLYNVDTDDAKSFTSGAHLTDKRLIYPELDITMNISKLSPSPAINPNARAAYIGTNGRQYYRAGRGYKDLSGDVEKAPNLTASDIPLSGQAADWQKGGPCTTLLRSVVVTFSSYKSDSFDTLDDFIDYGMSRYYCQQHDNEGVETQGGGFNTQNDTQLCGIVFQRPFGNAEDAIAEDSSESTSDESKGHVYAYALPVTKWEGPHATSTSAGVDLIKSSYGHYGIFGTAGMALIDNSPSTQIQGNDAGSNSGIKNIVVQPKYDAKYWDPNLNGTCSLSAGDDAPSRQTCEQKTYSIPTNTFVFTSGSTTGTLDGGTMDSNLAIGQRITQDWTGLQVLRKDTRITDINGDTDIEISQAALRDGPSEPGGNIIAWGTWKPTQYTNINGAIEPHWVKIPLDEFFTMKFVFDKYAKYGEQTGKGATFSYQDYTTGLPTDYQMYSHTDRNHIFGVPIRCYFDGGLSGSTNLGNPIKQGEDIGPSGTSIESLPYINLPMMFTPVKTNQGFQGFTQQDDNWKGMVESWPKHMTIWVNNYRYTEYDEGLAEGVTAETNALFRGAYMASVPTNDYVWSTGRREGADSILFGDAPTGATETGAATEFFLNPEAEVFIDSIELKYFNHPITNHSIQAGDMQRFINLENNKILTPVTTNTYNTIQHGQGYSNISPVLTSTTLRSLKGYNHEGLWSARNPGLNISIGFKDDPATYFPVTGAGTGNAQGKFPDNSGRVDDIYLLLNNFSTSQFGRIDYLAPTVAWKPVAGLVSLGNLSGSSTNYAGWLGTDFRGRTWASGCTISGSAKHSSNRAAWAGTGFTGSNDGGVTANGGVSPDYAGWAFYPIESGAGAAQDGNFSFGSGTNTYLSCDGMTQKGFIRMSQDLTYNDNTSAAGASLLDRWQKAPNSAVAAKIMGVQGSYQMGQGSEAVINSNTHILVDAPQIFSEALDDTYLVYRQDRRGAKYNADGTDNTDTDFDRFQLGYKKVIRLAAASDSAALSDDMVELVVYEADGTTLIPDGVLFADDGKTKLCVSDNLGELWISPLRYWVNMSFIDENLDYRRAYEAINAINKVPLDTATTALGSTYNEWLYTYNSGSAATKGTSGIYEKPWILGNAENSSLVLTTDYGYGAYDEEAGTGGQLGEATAVLNQYCEADISGIVQGGGGGGMMGGGTTTSQDLNLLVELSRQSTSKTITLIGDDSTDFDDEYKPALIWQFHDDLPKVSKLVVNPAFNALEKDVNLYELTTENLNSLKFTWEEEGEDIWYRMLMIDTVAIPDKYHKCIFHMPLNEFKASTPSGSRPQIPKYYFYDYSDTLISGTTAASTSAACRTSIEGLAGYAFQGVSTAATKLRGQLPEVAYSASTLLKDLTEYTFVIHAIPQDNSATAVTGNYLFSQGLVADSTGFKVQLNSAKKVVVKHMGVSLTGTSIQLCDGETPLNIIVTYKTGSTQSGRQPLELYVNGTLEDYDTATGTAVISSTSGAVIGGTYNSAVSGVGTVVVTTNTTCTGDGTEFTKTFEVGDDIILSENTETREITEITSDTVMTIVSATNTTEDNDYTFAGNNNTWAGLIEEVLIYNKRWDIVPEGGEYIFNSEALLEKVTYESGSNWQTQNAKMFAFDYHNIRGSASDVVAQSNLVGWKVTTS